MHIYEISFRDFLLRNLLWLNTSEYIVMKRYIHIICCELFATGSNLDTDLKVHIFEKP